VRPAQSSGGRAYRSNDMVLCPIAIAVGCKKCPVFAVCPVKGIIGDYKKEDDAPAKPATGKARQARKTK
jgi:hypothetical protein